MRGGSAPEPKGGMTCRSVSRVCREPRGICAILPTNPLDWSPRHVSRYPLEAAMTLNEPTQPTAGDNPSAGPEDLLRAVHDFQRGADREKSFELLFRRFRPRIERFLAPRVFSPEERLDLTQAIFLRIYRGLEGYRGEGSLEGWVLQIAVNVYRHWRDRQPGGR